MPIMEDTLNYVHLKTVLDYMSTDIETIYETNIKQRFCSYVENVSLQRREKIEAVNLGGLSTAEKKQQNYIICRELRDVKNDILSRNNPKKSNAQYHEWIDQQRVFCNAFETSFDGLKSWFGGI